MYGWNINIDDDGHTLIVRPQGEVDMSTAPALETAFRSCSDGHKAIICDLSGVTFLHSTGLRLLHPASATYFGRR